MSSSVPISPLPYSLPLDPTIRDSLQSAAAHSLPFQQLTINKELQRPLQYECGFSEFEEDKIRRTLCLESSSVHNRLKLQALGALHQLLHTPTRVVTCITSGLFQEIIVNCWNQQVEIREACTKAVQQITQNPYGLTSSLPLDLVPRFTSLSSLSECSSVVRAHVLTIYLNYTTRHEGAQQIMQAGIVQECIAKIEAETDALCQLLSVRVLCGLVREGTGHALALQHGVIKAAVAQIKKLQNNNQNNKHINDIKAELAKLLMLMSVALNGKEECVSYDATPLLFSLLSSNSAGVRVNSAAALSNVSNCHSGKLACLALPTALDTCIRHLDDVDAMVQHHALCVLTNLSEHPTVRTAGTLRRTDCIENIKSKTLHPNSIVKHAAQVALDRILWEP